MSLLPQTIQPVSISLNLGSHIFKETPEEILWQANFNSHNTKETYNDAVQAFMSFLGISSLKDLRRVSRQHVIAYRNALQDNGSKPSTINNRLSALSSMFSHLAEKRVVESNPVTTVKRLKAEYAQVKSKCLTRTEARRMIEVPASTACISKEKRSLQALRDRAIMHVFFFAGCRISELCNLRVGDYFEEKGYFILDFKLKGGKRNRVPINLEAKIAIDAYLTESGHAQDPESPVFVALKGNQNLVANNKTMNRSSVFRLWKKYSALAGISGSTPHSARTTFVSEAIENDCPIEKVQKTVGHSQIKTTQMYCKREVSYRESASFSVRY